MVLILAFVAVGSEDLSTFCPLSALFRMVVVRWGAIRSISKCQLCSIRFRRLSVPVMVRLERAGRRARNR